MKLPQTLNTRLVLSHLLVSIVSIVLMAAFAGRSIYNAAIAEAEHSLQGLAFAAGNALELPIQEFRAGRVEASFIENLLVQLFADSPEITFTVYSTDGSPIADSRGELPKRAGRGSNPEVWEALEDETGRGVATRVNPQGKQIMYMAVLVQREIEVTAILRLGLPLEAAQNAARQSLLILLGVTLLIAVGVSLFGWILAKNLARPIQVLTRAAKNMEHGDLGVRVEPSGPYEMRRLSEAFNKMASRLQANVTELRAFVANASHELRTPLTVVKLRAEALQDGAMEDPDISKRFMGEIEHEVDRLVRMVNDLLDLSRMEAGMDAEQPKLIDMSTLSTEVYETFKIRADRAGVNLECDIESGLPPVMGNEDQLMRVFYNLLDNAIKYTSSGGKVELTVKRNQTDGYIRTQVSDNGQGIGPEHLPHVFERFYRVETNPARSGMVRGSGLGLSIAKSIVENHGGVMGVASEVDSGTTLWADLPAAGE